MKIAKIAKSTFMVSLMVALPIALHSTPSHAWSKANFKGYGSSDSFSYGQGENSEYSTQEYSQNSISKKRKSSSRRSSKSKSKKYKNVDVSSFSPNETCNSIFKSGSYCGKKDATSYASKALGFGDSSPTGCLRHEYESTSSNNDFGGFTKNKKKKSYKNSSFGAKSYATSNKLKCHYPGYQGTTSDHFYLDSWKQPPAGSVCEKSDSSRKSSKKSYSQFNYGNGYSHKKSSSWGW